MVTKSLGLLISRFDKIIHFLLEATPLTLNRNSVASINVLNLLRCELTTDGVKTKLVLEEQAYL
jgi:hypothetical protein